MAPIFVNANPKHPEIPGFKIIEMLGEGAMARVYLAVDEALDRKVAMKVMNRSLAHDPSFRDRFLAEAKDTAKFDHPGIVSIHSMGVVDDNYYLVLEYLEDGTLKDHIRSKQQEFAESGIPPEQLFSAQEAVRLLAEMADALDYAHRKKVVHRDLKPANILFNSEGKAVLSDFGIAKSVTENRELTMTGYSVGTPAYMSPEQKLGAADIDGRSDLYSLGIVFYEILTGTKPFNSVSGSYADLRKEMEAPIPQLPSGVSHLQPVLDRLLAKDPGDRYQTAGDLLQDIRSIMGGGGHDSDDATVLLAPMSGPMPAAHAQHPVKGHKKVILAVIATLVIGGAGVTAWQMMPEPPPEVIPVDAETAGTIEELLNTATTFIAVGRLIDPPVANANAAELYHRVLKLQPHNPDATAGLAQVLEGVIADIESLLENGEKLEAGRMLNSAAHYFPGNEELADLREQAGQ
ncbi:MAG: protein kinase [Xanthomonadales bacterium]|jgi:serine/threonine-protein kinase PpkA|nr:protein kinase [Xanthomonadales bacterium]